MPVCACVCISVAATDTDFMKEAVATARRAWKENHEVKDLVQLECLCVCVYEREREEDAER
jgi:hypothetical protein